MGTCYPKSGSNKIANGEILTLESNYSSEKSHDKQYLQVRKDLRSYKIDTVYYNSTYVINYFTFGSTWVGFDDVEAIRAKVAYAKEKGLLGYNVWQVPNDHNWELSKAAAQAKDKPDHYKNLLVITLPAIASVILLLGCIICYRRRRVIIAKGMPFTF
nr:chitinase II [Tanacetum cinerariifolium]